MKTYQDYEIARDSGERTKRAFLLQVIQEHRSSELYRTAQIADDYDAQRNRTICQYVQTIMTLTGLKVADFTASNAKIASNFFNRLNTQRCTYSLGNGVTFAEHTHKEVNGEGQEVTVDETKEQLGAKFDTDLKNIGYYGLIHGISFGFWNVDRLHLYKITEFVPLWDEDDGRLRAGVRWWQIDAQKPMIVELYEEDGMTRYRTQKDNPTTLDEIRPKKAYMTVTRKAPVDPEPEVIGETNYGRLPVVPFWGSRLHQSTLVGMRQGVDSYDLVRSGFANDLHDVSQIYWLIENCGGMTPQELERVRDQMKLLHIVQADTSAGGKITPYTQEIPYQAREAYLKGIRGDIYESFGGLDVHTIAAGATNDHIDAAYQPLDENADDFEYQVIEFVQQVLALQGIEDTPVFKRNRISNQKEQVEMVAQELSIGVLDRQTAMAKLPNIDPDEIVGIIARLDAENEGRFQQGGTEEDDDE